MKLAKFIKNQFAMARYVGRGNFDCAIKILEESLTNTAEDVPSLQMIAQCHYWSKRDQMAVDSANRVLSYDTKNFGAAQLLSIIHAARKEHDSAVSYTLLALENYPKPVPLMPKYLFSLLQFASRIFPKLKRVHVRAKADFENLGKADEEWFGWAKKYLAWYEEAYGKRARPTVH